MLFFCTGSSSNIWLYVTVPLAVVVLLVVLTLVGVIIYLGVIQRKKSNEPYMYRSLSDREEEEDQEGEQGGGKEDTGIPKFTGSEEDLEKGEDS